MARPNKEMANEYRTSASDAAGGQSVLTDGLAVMVPEHEFSDKQRELYDTMSDISEDCYCAGWMMGLEYAIWGALQDGDRRYGMGEMDAEQLERCRRLSQELDGWVIWVDDDNVPELPNEEWGPRFVTMAHWLGMLPANVQGQPRRVVRVQETSGRFTASAATEG